MFEILIESILSNFILYGYRSRLKSPPSNQKDSTKNIYLKNALHKKKEQLRVIKGLLVR